MPKLRYSHRGTSSLFVFLLTGLLLIAPCKVRKAIQSSLGIPHTEVLNKAQSQLASESCCGIKSHEIQQQEVPSLATPVTLLFSEIEALVPEEEGKQSLPLFDERGKAPPPVPLFILYQNLKVFLMDTRQLDAFV